MRSSAREVQRSLYGAVHESFMESLQHRRAMPDARGRPVLQFHLLLESQLQIQSYFFGQPELTRSPKRLISYQHRTFPL